MPLSTEAKYSDISVTIEFSILAFVATHETSPDAAAEIKAKTILFTNDFMFFVLLKTHGFFEGEMFIFSPTSTRNSRLARTSSTYSRRGHSSEIGHLLVRRRRDHHVIF